MPEEKISGTQAVILLFLSQAFNTLNYIPSFQEVPEGMSQLWGAVIAFVIQLAVLVPALFLDRKYPGQNVIAIGYTCFRPLGFAFALLYALAILTQLVGSLVGFEYFLANAVYPNASVALIVLTMCAACFWAAGRGLQSLARAAGFVFVFFAVSVLFISIASIRSVDLLNLRPALSEPVRGAVQSGLNTLSRSAELYLFPLLFPKIKGSKIGCALGLTISSFLFQLGTTFLIVTVLGEFGRTQTFPYYTLASISDTSIFQRLDSLHMAIWTFIAFLRVTLLIHLASYCLKMVFPLKAHRAVTPLLFTVTAAGALLLGYSPEMLENAGLNPGVVVPLLTAGAPLLMLLPLFRKRGDAA